MNITVSFATFCYSGDAHRLHKLGQLKKQVLSNNFSFNEVIVIHQKCNPQDYENPNFEDCSFNIKNYIIGDLDDILNSFDIDLEGQYKSDTDNHHWWKPHVVNHLAAITKTYADYIVFADNDCWMIQNDNWIEHAIGMFQKHPSVFIISPNDGEPERFTRRFSQQMFMVKSEDFRNADFNQPDWDGNVNIPGGPMPEYFSMLEGRMQIYADSIDKLRYVCPSRMRYWHHNKIKEDGHFETDISKW